MESVEERGEPKQEPPRKGKKQVESVEERGEPEQETPRKGKKQVESVEERGEPEHATSPEKEEANQIRGTHERNELYKRYIGKI